MPIIDYSLWHMKTIEMNCPVCKKPLVTVRGGAIDPLDGFTVYCATPHGKEIGQCSAQEVSGHGRTAKDAFEVITDKFSFAMKQSNS
jgi:hypothetical protein